MTNYLILKKTLINLESCSPSASNVTTFLAPSLFTWLFGEPESTSFWELPRVLTEFANFLMYEWIPVEIYDPDIEEFEDSALIFEMTRGVSAALLFAIDFVLLNCNHLKK